jgi:hypothetical protein
MKVLSGFVPPFMFVLVPDIPVGIRARFIGEIPFKKKITPSNTIAFVFAFWIRDPQNLVY